MSRRLEKVSSLLRQQAAAVLTREFPTKGAAISVARVDVSPDLKNARIYVSIAGKEPADLRGRLEKAAPGIIADYLARHTDLRCVPHMRIQFDDSGEYAQHVSRLIDSAHESQE